MSALLNPSRCFDRRAGAQVPPGLFCFKSYRTADTCCLSLSGLLDTIDLQDHDNPSAQDHSRANAYASKQQAASGNSVSIAPHQAETLREVAAEAAEENLHSPRISWQSGDVGDLHQYAGDLAADVANSLNNRNMQSQDTLAVAQNGGPGSATSRAADQDADLDGDTDDAMDDDMDKISSSPSIEDGAYTVSTARAALSSAQPPIFSLSSTSSEASLIACTCLEAVVTAPLSLDMQRWDLEAFKSNGCHHLLLGEYGMTARAADDAENDDRARWTPNDDRAGGLDLKYDAMTNEYHGTLHHGEGGISNVVASDGQAQGSITTPDERESSVVTDDACGDDDDDGDDFDDLTLAYEPSEEDDDTNFLFIDERFIDSGWGGECLQDAEDIDFEFVYALHTFVATVEGQANATKGDTMVLLDDSNSYWWLVRVVKDSSIGQLTLHGNTAYQMFLKRYQATYQQNISKRPPKGLLVSTSTGILMSVSCGPSSACLCPC